MITSASTTRGRTTAGTGTMTGGHRPRVGTATTRRLVATTTVAGTVGGTRTVRTAVGAMTTALPGMTTAATRQRLMMRACGFVRSAQKLLVTCFVATFASLCPCLVPQVI